MIDAHEIRDKLAQMANDRLSVNAFEKWFAPNSWSVYSEGSSQAIDLVASIEAVFSERNDLRLKPQQVRQGLLVLLEGTPVPVENYNRSYVSSNVPLFTTRPASFKLLPLPAVVVV